VTRAHTRLQPKDKLKPGAKRCVGCGYCCRSGRCQPSYMAEGKLYKDPLEAMGEQQGCPWLWYNKDEGRWRCKIAERFRSALAIGEGCCMPNNPVRKAYPLKKG